jgi:hypothetical protein
LPAQYKSQGWDKKFRLIHIEAIRSLPFSVVLRISKSISKSISVRISESENIPLIDWTGYDLEIATQLRRGTWESSRQQIFTHNKTPTLRRDLLRDQGGVQELTRMNA